MLVAVQKATEGRETLRVNTLLLLGKKLDLVVEGMSFRT